MTQMTMEASRTRPVRWGAPGVPDELGALDDHDLLAGGVADLVAAAANGRAWARLVDFHRRREDDEGGRHAVAPHDQARRGLTPAPVTDSDLEF